MELNPTIAKWPLIHIGQKIVVPAPAPASSSPAAQDDQSATNDLPGNTTEVTLAPGDSLNELARRFNTTVERLKELNPQISNWARIQPGQKVLVPSPAG
jgi:LysM repeat protein